MNEIDRIESDNSGIVGIIAYDEGNPNPREEHDGHIWTLVADLSRYGVVGLDEELPEDPEVDCPDCDQGVNEWCIDGIELDTVCVRCDGFGTINDMGIYLKETFGAYLVAQIYYSEHGLSDYSAGEPQLIDEFEFTGQETGFAVLSKKALDEYRDECLADMRQIPEDWKNLTASQRVGKILDGEMEEYTDWANGHIYGYYLENVPAGIESDSCWGIYGYDYAEEMCEDAIKYAERQMAKEKAERDYWKERGVMTTNG